MPPERHDLVVRYSQAVPFALPKLLRSPLRCLLPPRAVLGFCRGPSTITMFSRPMRLALVAFALVPAASALRLPATRLPARRSGRPVAQVSPEGDAKDAASTAGFGGPRPATDAKAAAALSRGRQALEQYRATAEAQTGATIPKPVLRWDERARASVRKKLQPWVPNLAVLRRDLKPALKGFGFTQKEKARAYLQQRPPFSLSRRSDRPQTAAHLPPALPSG